MRIKKRAVFCRECGHDFDSEVSNPRCARCNSRKVSNVEDIPRQYAKRDLERLKIEVLALKETQQFNLNMFEKLFKRIKSLESNQKGK